MAVTSIKYRRLDSDGDYTFGLGSQGFVTNTEACAQAIKTRLELYEGEWWEDTNTGLPLWQKILASPGSNKNAIDVILGERVSGTTGVKKITSQSGALNRKTRGYTYSAYVETEWSTGVTITTSV
jgi:hypothetical protein